MLWFLAQGQVESSGFMELLQSVDKELLGTVMILGTIGFFVSIIVCVCTISSTITNLRVVKMHNTMVQDLLQKGYSVDDIERLTMGQGIGGQVKKLVRAATNRINKTGYQEGNRPVPPVKQTV